MENEVVEVGVMDGRVACLMFMLETGVYVLSQTFNVCLFIQLNHSLSLNFSILPA